MSFLLKCSVPLKGRSAGHDNESWIFAIPVGQEFYDGKRMRTVTEEQAHVYLANTRRAMAFFASVAPEGGTPYRFPIKEDHKGGKRYGDILDVKLSGEGDWYGIWGKVRWKDGTWEEIAASNREHVSIGVKRYKLQDGTELGPTIIEISLTEDPRLHSIGTIQDTLGVQLSRLAASIEDEEDDMEELTALLNQIAESQQAILTGIQELTTALAQGDGEGGDDEEEEPQENSQADGEGGEAPAAEEPAGEPDDTPAAPAQLSQTFDLDGFTASITSAVKSGVTEALKQTSGGGSGQPHTNERGNSNGPSAPGGAKDYSSLRDLYLSQGMDLEEASDKALLELQG